MGDIPVKNVATFCSDYLNLSGEEQVQQCETQIQRHVDIKCTESEYPLCEQKTVLGLVHEIEHPHIQSPTPELTTFFYIQKTKQELLRCVLIGHYDKVMSCAPEPDGLKIGEPITEEDL